jgi:hypothetical protein
MKKELSLIITKSVTFILIFLLIDILAGSLLRKLFFAQDTGKYARLTYATQELKKDIIIMGSSHAIRHYVPSVFDSVLNKPTYNMGAEGQKLLYQLASQKMILSRYNPKIIVLNVDYDWLYYNIHSYSRLNDLHPYYSTNKNEIENILSLNKSYTQFKLFFNAYQLNSTIIHIIKYKIKPQEDFLGYRPLYGILNEKKLEINNKEQSSDTIDKQMVEAYKQFISNVKENNIKLFLVGSPKPHNINTNSESLSLLKEIAQKNDIPYLDFYNSSEFLKQYQLFHDDTHLNNNGAIKFSKLVSKEIAIYLHADDK